MSVHERFSRAIQAEAIRLGGLRGLFARTILPLGLVLPMVVTLVIGAAAEFLHSVDGLIQVREVTTDNSIYWIISLGVTVYAVAAAYAQASIGRGSVGELARHILPKSGVSMLARWVVLGIIGAVCSFFVTLMMLVALPALYPQVYSQVDAASATGVRFLWAVPAYCFAAVGIGLGIGALIQVPAAAVAAITLWSLLVEPAFVYIPNGADLIGYLPFLNGTFGSGQDIALEPPWSPNGALLYTLAIAAVVVALGYAATQWRRAKRP